MESSLLLRCRRLSLPAPALRILCPTLERLRKLGCAILLKEVKKQVASKRYVGFLASVTNLKSQYLNSESQRNQKRRKHESLNSNEFTGKFNSCDLSRMTSLTQISFTISLNIAAKCGSAALAACKTSSCVILFSSSRIPISVITLIAKTGRPMWLAAMHS